MLVELNYYAHQLSHLTLHLQYSLGVPKNLNPLSLLRICATVLSNTHTALVYIYRLVLSYAFATSAFGVQI